MVARLTPHRDAFINLMKANMKSYAQDQADFMDMSGQKRYSADETVENLVARHAGFLAELAMHKGLIEEEVNREFIHNYNDLIMNPPRGLSVEQMRVYYVDALTKLVDDCVDSVYVITSFVNKIGIDFDVIWYLVHQANIAKGFPCPTCDVHGAADDCPSCKGTGKVVKRRGDGKTLKPKGWTAPDATIREMIVEMILRSRRDARIERQDNL